jgi:nucleoside-diphosphate-sugar epimerase
MAARFLVTGGAGFIGSHLVRRLLERGDRVRVLDNFSTGSRTNLAGLEPDLEIIEGDLRSHDRVGAAARGADVVLHLGALPSVPRSVQDPLTTNAVNVDGTLNVLTAARDLGAGKVVFASSSSIYGSDGPLPRHEDLQPRPISPYAVSKLAAESYCTSFSRTYGLETVCLRYFNVYGPNQSPASQYAAVVPRFVTALRDGRPVTIHGDGTQTRDFTYVTDVVDATLMAADLRDECPPVLNVAAGGSTSVARLAEAIAAVLGVEVEHERLPARPDEVRHSTADITRAVRILGFRPAVTVERGLEMTVAAMSDRPVLVGGPG